MSPRKIIPLASHRRRRAWRRLRNCCAVVALACILAILSLSNAPQDRLAVAPAQVDALRGGDARAGTLRGGNAWAGVSRQTLTGRVQYVFDGDTIEVAGTRIRLARLDCAEAGTTAGNRATAQMRRLAGAARVTCTLTGETSYDRQIGSCMLSDGRDLGMVMIAGQFCTAWR